MNKLLSRKFWMMLGLSGFIVWTDPSMIDPGTLEKVVLVIMGWMGIQGADDLLKTWKTHNSM